MRMANNLPAAPIHDLVVHPRDNELVVGTHGRSIYIANLEHIQQLTATILDRALHPLLFVPFSIILIGVTYRNGEIA